MNFLFVDQHGVNIYAKNRKELIKKCGGGRVSIQYCYKDNGSTVRNGYIVGDRWFTQYAVVEKSIKL